MAKRLANPTFTGTVAGIDKTMVGLSNVDNTTDLLKPVSTATQTALDLKANSAATQSALDLKAPLASPTFTGTVAGIDKAMVGLGNVDNTTDLLKPISTATQTALDLKAPLANPTFTGTVNGITKTMVGLNNVDNTSDAAKPISTATQTALDDKLTKSSTKIAIGYVAGSSNQGDYSVAIGSNAAQLGQGTQSVAVGFAASSGANNATALGGYAAAGHVNSTAIGYQAVANAANTIQLGADGVTIPGSTAITNVKTSGTLTAGTVTYPNAHNSSAGQVLTTDANGVASWSTPTTPTATSVGLGNVNNTSDADKPVSSATQTALDLKANSTATQSALNLKAPLANPTFTGTVAGIDKTMVGLSNVDNTTDLLKPISTATQTALDLKASLASPTFTGTPTLPTGTIGVTQTAGDNTTALATTAFVTAANASNAQNFVDLTTAQTIAGIKTFSTDALINGLTVGRGGGNLSRNTAIGSDVLLNNNSNGVYNTAIGYQAQINNTEGEQNTATGSKALRFNTTGNSNTAFGNNALSTNETGSNNTVIGSFADVRSGSLNNATAIGYDAKVAASNTIQLGNTSVTNVKTSGTVNAAGFSATVVNGQTVSTASFGVAGLTTPGTLTAGTVTYPNAHNSSAGQVLTTNASGVASWETPTTPTTPTATTVGLNNVDNTSDANKPVSTATQAALDLKAPLASPTFTGTPTLPTGTIGVTQTAGDNTTALATTAFVQTALNTAFTNEVSDEATATVGQTSFTLSKTPGTNSKVKMYINGIRISNNAYTISGTTLTYIPGNNGAYALVALDRIQFDFSY